MYTTKWGVDGEQRYLASRIAAVGATGVGLHELTDGEAICGFLWRDGDVLAHPCAFYGSGC
jgi:hypothetical protein